MPQIRIRNGPQKGKIVPVSIEQPVRIGREHLAAIQVLDKGVSREHAEIYRVGEMIFIRDLKSRNGTFVNDERVGEELLRQGDVIRVGSTQLLFESGQAGPPVSEISYAEEESFKTSLDLKVDDLFSTAAAPGNVSEHFRAVCRASQLLHSAPEVQKLFDSLLDLIQDHIPADHLFIFLQDPDSGLIVPRASRQKKSGGSFAVSRTILKRVISEARAILTADAMQDERFKTGDSIVLNQIRSVLCVPILAELHPIGALYAVNARLAETFDENDLELLTAVGAQLGAHLNHLRRRDEQQRLYQGLLGRLVTLLEDHTPGASGHAERVGRYASAIARELSLPEPQIQVLQLAGLLHALGRLLPGGRGRSEEDSLKQGLEALAPLPYLKDIAAVLAAVHERLDGSGRPKGLKGEQIPIGARVLAVADAFDCALTESGADVSPERLDAHAVRKAFTELDAQVGAAFDHEVLRALMLAFRHGVLLPSSSPSPPGPTETVRDLPPAVPS
jgi:HD-GYP domain-containing protein (c-di-GMP phosphodiesterase class II)/pSer/pThr/pTyr-binding forkhead associated (FHA) protein